MILQAFRPWENLTALAYRISKMKRSNGDLEEVLMTEDSNFLIHLSNGALALEMEP
jgi:hypothetical protein